MFPVLARFQIVDDIKAIVLPVFGCNLEVLLLSHMFSQNRCTCENLFTVKALQSAKYHVSSVYSFREHSRSHVLCKLSFQNVQELVNVDEIIRKSNVEVVFRKHVLKQCGSGVA